MMTLTRQGAATAPDGSSCTGPLASHIAGFAAQLSRKGYAQNTVHAKCAVLADLSRWLEQLRAQDLHGFILREVQRVSRSHGKGVVTALRSFLRFLLQRGAIGTDLARMLPGVASWRLSHLPKSLSPEQVQRLLACCDRSTASGKRVYAILLLLARLGLRGGEVLAMTLEDLDWERGEIIVRGKGQRLERLPLPADVGAALACYLGDVRPACATRRVFIRMKAPQQGLAGPGAICCIVRRALRRAGLDPM